MIALALALATASAADTVRLSGVVEHTGSGAIRLELLTRTQGVEPMLAWSGTLSGPGPFTVQVPRHLGAVTLRAAVDQDRDGVGPGDPQGLVEDLEITTQPVDGVEISLSLPERSRQAGSDARQ